MILTTAHGLRLTLGISIGSISNLSASGNMARPVSWTEFSAQVTAGRLGWRIFTLLSAKAMLGQFTEQTPSAAITLK